MSIVAFKTAAGHYAQVRLPQLRQVKTEDCVIEVAEKLVAFKHFLCTEGTESKRVECRTQAICAGATVPDTNDAQLRLVSLTHPSPSR